MRVAWRARRSNQSILKEINPEYSLEGHMLKLKLLMQTADSFEKTLMLGKIEGRRIRGWQKMRWLDGITESLDMNLGELREIVRVREAWHAAIHIGPRRLRHNLVTEQQGVVKTSRLLKEKRLPPQLSCPVSNHIRMLS